MLRKKQWLTAAIATVCVIAVGIAAFSLSGIDLTGSASAQAPGGMALMAVDMDPEDGAPPPTFTPTNFTSPQVGTNPFYEHFDADECGSDGMGNGTNEDDDANPGEDSVADDGCPAVGKIGTVQSCARMNTNTGNTLDADEEAIDSLTIDVIADDIPQAFSSIGYSMNLSYPFPGGVIAGFSAAYANTLLGQEGSSSVANAGEANGDFDGSFKQAGADTSATGNEWGDGPMVRLNVQSPGPTGAFSPSATLNGAIDAVTTSIIYTSTGDPFIVGISIRIETEDMIVSAINEATNTLTVTRGANGTAAAAHATALAITRAEIATGSYPMDLTTNIHVDGTNTAWSPLVTQNGTMAVNQACPAGGVSADLAVNGTPAVDAPPIGTINNAFTVTVNGNIINNGPGTASGTATLSLTTPGDCTKAPNTTQTDQTASLASGASEAVTASWQVTCTSVSDHQFGGSVSVAVDLPATDPTGGNNGPVNATTDNTAVSGNADLSFTSVVVAAPTTGTQNVAFNVDVVATLHNAGPVTPVNADVTVDLVMPAGCTRNPNTTQVQDNVSVTTAADTVVSTKTWSVTCTTTGMKTFNGSATAVVDQLHVIDNVAGNNTGNGSDSTDVQAQVISADIAVNGAPSVNSPATGNINVAFSVSVNGSVINNGPGAASGTATLSLTTPGDCTKAPNTTQTDQTASLASGNNEAVTASWQVTCTSVSDHAFGGSVSVAVDAPATDPNAGNNGPVNAPTNNTEVSGNADLSFTSVVVAAPTTGTQNVAFNVDVVATLHNAGPVTPVNADVTVDLVMPAGCTRNPNTTQVQDNVSVTTAADTVVPTKTWSVTCTTTGMKTFNGSATAVVDQLHVIDNVAGNNTGNGSDSTDVQAPVISADIAVNGTPAVDAPTLGTINNAFTVTVNGSVINNGPGTASGVATLNLTTPGDCTKAPNTGQNDTTASLASGASEAVTASWQVTCTSVSDHAFGGSVSVVVQAPATDPTPGNNGPVNATTDNTAVSGNADLSFTSVVVAAPATGTTGSAFNVDVTATVHNAGPVTPVTADVTVDLTMPAGCTRNPNTTQVQDNAIVGTIDVPVTKTWSVTCTTTGDKTFNGSAAVVVDQLHVTDGTAGNNTGNGSDTTNIQAPAAQADLAVNGTPSIDAPATANTGANFNVTVNGNIINNGPDAAVGVATLNLTVPGDCTKTPNTSQDDTTASLGSGANENVSQTWVVNCTNVSNHDFSGNVSVAAQAPATDPTPGNNGPVAATGDTTAVSGTADLSFTSVTVDAPATGTTGTPFNVSVTATVHNAGAVTPANADVTIDLPAPAGCTRTPDNSQVQQDVSVGADTPVTKTWSMDCSTTGMKTFNGSATVAVDQLHVTDDVAGNNTGNGGDATDVQAPAAQADLSIGSAAVSAPATEAVNTDFTLTLDATVSNGGPDSASGTATLDITVPSDCTKAPNNSQTDQTATLANAGSEGVTASWTVNCDNPSNHLFEGTATVAVDAPASDPNSANNTASVTSATTAVTGEADVSIASVAVDAPASGVTGSMFNVSVTANVHNDGPVDPATADVTVDLTVPSGCTRNPDDSQSENGVSVSTASDSPVMKTWSVTCTETGDKTFNGSASVLLNQTHATDPDDTNNGGSDPDGDTTNIEAPTAQADMEVNGTPTIDAPATGTIGNAFTVTVNGNIKNNGPDAATGTATLSLTVPNDCSVTPDVGSQADSHQLASGADEDVSASWQVTCTNPSNHAFSGSVSVAADAPAVDPVPGNNGPVNATGSTTAVTATTDVSVVSVVVDAPTTGTAGSPFNVTVITTLHNLGLATTTADLSVTLTLPTGCTTTSDNPQTQDDVVLAQSVNVGTSKTWSVTCDAGSKTFDGSATATISQPHVTDSNDTNNGAQDADGDTTTVEGAAAQADLAVQGTPTVDAAASANTGTPFTVTVNGSAINNGSDSASGDATLNLTVPSDCTKTPDSSQTDSFGPLSQGGSEAVSASWQVTCTNPSNHEFGGSVSVASTDGTSDPNPGNNGPVSATTDTTPVSGSADVSVVSVTVNAPDTANKGVAFNVSVTATIHNNGPVTPVTANLTVDLTVPAGCTKSPNGNQPQNGVSLAMSTNTAITKTWSVTCTTTGAKAFDGSASVLISQQHVTEANDINNIGGGSDSTTINDVQPPAGPQCDGKAATKVGTNGSNVIIGTNGADVIVAKGGHDLILGLGGNDTICGNDGNDIILGGDGNDRMFGEAGNDVMDGGHGDDYVHGGSSSDVLSGGRGNDTVVGGSGNDTMKGGDGNDQMFGEDGNDSLFGEDGPDVLNGGAGNDSLFGGSGNDAMDGWTGFDFCNGGSGADTAVNCEIKISV